jgi:hypothetical protein
MKRLVAIALLILVAYPTSAQAGLISFRSTIVPNFELNLFNPPFDVPPGGVTLPGTATGYLDFTFDFQDGLTPTLDFVSVSGSFRGSLAGGLTFTLLATGLDVGTATNVQTSGGELTNADLDFSLFFEMYPDMGGLLIPDTSLPFSGNVKSLPFLAGTVFAGPTTPPTPPVPGSAFLPGPNGTIVEIPNAVSVQNRTLTVVPEPGSFAVFGCGIIAAAAFGRRRKATCNS